MSQYPVNTRSVSAGLVANLPGLITFELLFTLFLFAGRYKNDPRLYWVPVDITLLFFVLSLLGAILILLRRQFTLPRAPVVAGGILLLFVAWMAVGTALSPSSSYATEKLTYFGALSTWAYFGSAFIIGPSPRRLQRFLNLLVLLGVVMAIESLSILAIHGNSGFINAFGGNYIGVGRTLGLAIIPPFAALVTRSRTTPSSLLHLALCIMFGVTMLFTGARGPLLASVFSILAAIAYASRLALRSFLMRKANRRAMWLAILVIAVPTIALFQSDSTARTLSRFEVLLESEGGGVSASARVFNYSQAIQMIKQSPIIGHGTGAFPILLGLEDKRGYPHNLILEILAELGIIGIVLFALFFGLSISSRRRLSSQRPYVTISLIMLLANTFANSMVSGDLPDNRLLLMALGLIAGLRAPEGVPREGHR